MYLTRRQVEELTGLNWWEIRRMEKAGEFPRRVMGRPIARRKQRILKKGKMSWRERVVRAGKVRWREEKVKEWIAESEMSYKVKVLAMIAKNGIKYVKEPNEIYYRFIPPPGLVFSRGEHRLVTDVLADVADWKDVYENRHRLSLNQCGNPYCNECKQNRMVYELG